jgi:hypothetical protein
MIFFLIQIQDNTILGSIPKICALFLICQKIFQNTNKIPQRIQVSQRIFNLVIVALETVQLLDRQVEENILLGLIIQICVGRR